MAVDATTAVKDLSTLPAKVRGFADYSPKEQVLFSLWKQTLATVYERNGFNPFDVSPFIRKEFLLEKGGINHEIYAVSRIHGNEPTPYGIAFDRTVPFALWVRDHKGELQMPFKRYDISLSYRGERPSIGRFRGFYQCDVDVVGPKLSLTNDVQCISALVNGLEALLASGINNPESRGFKMYLNHISVPHALFASVDVPKDKVEDAMRIVDKMDKIGKEEVLSELSTLLKGSVEESKIKDLVEVFSFKGPISQFKLPEGLSEKAEQGLKDLRVIMAGLADNGLDAESLHFCPGMVRGLNYYTGVVFETFLDALPRTSGSMLSGGRYDQLVDCFTKNRNGKTKATGIEGVGGSIGLTRLFDVLSRAGLVKPTVATASKVMVLTRGKIEAATWQVSRAIKEAGISCDLYSGNSGQIKKQLVAANKVGVPVSVMVMDKHTYCVKNMKTGEQDQDLDTIQKCVESVKRMLG